MKHYINKHNKSEKRRSIIEEAMKNSVQYQLKYATTPEEKLGLISGKNPLLHVFGHDLNQPRYEETYDNWINRQYIGEPEHITTIEEAREYLRNLRNEVEQ